MNSDDPLPLGRVELPLEVLGLVAPILAWVEYSQNRYLPQRGRKGRSLFDVAQEGWLRQELPSYSLDTVDEILELARRTRRRRRSPSPIWPVARGAVNRPAMAPPPGYDLADVLGRLGKRYFQWSSNELCVKAGMLEEIHELGTRLPVCHLIRHAHAQAVVEDMLSRRRVLAMPEQLGALPTASRSLRVVVERGLSEGHLHFWGVTHVDEVWANHLLGRPIPRRLRPFAAPEVRLLRLGRFSVRILALAVLFALRPTPAAGCQMPYRLFRRLDAFYLAGSPLATTQLAQQLEEELRQAVDASTCRSDDETTWLLSIVDPGAHRPRPRAAGTDSPIVDRIRSLARLHLRSQELLVEIGRTIVGIRGRESQAAHRAGHRLLRDFLHKALFRYLVYHTHHMQLATLRGRTTGLREFKEFYGAKQRQLLGPERASEHQLVISRLLEDRSVRLLEGRQSLPREGPGGLLPWVLDFARRTGGDPQSRLGIIIHFIKQEPEEARREQEKQLRERVRGRVRHELYRRKIRNEAFGLFHQLQTPHPMVPFIVGIDAANVELTTPPELLAPAFRFLRDTPIEGRGRLSYRLRFRVEREVLDLLEKRRLGVTYHVGEDFRHLLSGLRAIHELIAFMALQPGDRLGHAIALALDPEVWAAQVGYQAVLLKQEWLDTLVWVHHFLGPGDDTVGALGVEDMIQYLSWYIYRRPRLSEQASGKAGGHHDLSPLMLWDAWRLRQLDPLLLSVDHLLADKENVFPGPIPVGAAPRRWLATQQKIYAQVSEEIGSYSAFHILDRYWRDPGVWRRGHEITTVDMSSQRALWMQIARKAQSRLRELVRHRQLVIETNPTCNRMIGPMARLSDHHIFNLTLNENGKLARDVITTVNTDNPGVINTSLAHEYYLLGEILLQRGIPEGDVVAWLDWLRQNGHDYTFLRFLPKSTDRRYRKLLTAIDKDRGPLRDWMSAGRKLWRQDRRRSASDGAGS